ncbi:MAG: trypsin-like peptidase domain-containing protein [Thermoleophilaceae bacterium]|nr:trypsin-like peptidase domain-containing protein [Thermoleophilaceae bacterium]
MALSVLALGAIGVGGCGSDDGNSAAASKEKTETTRVQVVESSGKDNGFNPEALYKRLSPGVVTVISRGGGKPVLGGDNEGGLCSGFVLDDEGHIATNAHVILAGMGPGAKRADQLFVEFPDGNRVPAKVLGDDPNADVALLKVDPGGLPLTPLELGSSKDLVVGEPVAAIGSPFAERSTLTIGVVSALDRAIESLTDFRIGNAIQTDAAINPGNSGGPLLDSEGKVIGVNQQIKSEGGGGEGVGFAVPVDVVRRSLEELRENGKVNYGFLGVTSQGLYPQLAERLDLPVKQGALIVKVQKGSPGDEAGLSAGDDEITFQGQPDIPSNGDVITAVDGKELTRTDDLADRISLEHAGTEVELEILRDGEKRKVKVKLGARPRSVTRP